MKRVIFYGSIGVGKTTAGREIAKRWKDAFFVEEDLSKNISISDFYKDMKRFAFLSSTEMLAVMLENNCRTESGKNIAIIDQGVEELICYNRMELKSNILSENEFSVFKRLYNDVLNLVPTTDLYVYFHCSKQEQLRRIKNRDREFERDIDEDFLNRLNYEYARFTDDLEQTKLIKVDTENGVDYDWLIEKILSALK